MTTKSAKASPKKPTANASSKAVMERVRKECRRNNLSPKRLSEESGVYLGTCRKVINGNAVWLKNHTFSQLAAWLIKRSKPVSTVETPANEPADKAGTQLELPMTRGYIADEDDVIDELEKDRQGTATEKELHALHEQVSKLEAKYTYSERNVGDLRIEMRKLTQSLNNLAMSVVSLQSDMLRAERRGSDV